MARLPRRNFLALTGGAVVAGAIGPGAQTAAAGTRAVPPQTIPALQSWSTGAGQYTLPGTVLQIWVSTADAGQLRTTADVLAEDLRKVAAPRTVNVMIGDTPAAGDIVLRLAAIPGLNAEGYELEVGSTLQVRGARSGVFFGTRTIVQWLRQTTTLPAGLARDWPRFPERGFLVAHAPKYYTLTWWKGQIQEMAYLKMNLLWIYVGYHSTPLPEMKAIAAYAARYNITVIPQTNMPNHMTKLLAERPELALPGRLEALDLSKPAAYDWARGHLTSLLPEFDTPYWHLGADEYLVEFSGDFPVRYDLFPQLGAYAKQRFGSQAVPPDVLYGFMNDMNQTVRAAGKTMRIWNDGLLTQGTVSVQKNVVVEHWVQWPNRKTPQQLVNEGYKLSNSNGDFLYYDPGARRPDPVNLYERFRVGLFSGNQTVAETSPALLGAKIHLWTLPDVETEEFQSDRLMEPFRSLAQVLWGSPKPAQTYAGFAPLITTIGRPPGFPTGRHTVTPIAGATSVWPHRPVKVVFYDPIRPETLQLAEGGTEAGTPGRTTYDATTKTATFTPIQPWTYDKLCEARLRALDTAGNLVSHTWNFRIAKHPMHNTGYPRSLWADEVGPAVERHVMGRPHELGVRFRVDRPGLVLGVKFYKSAGDFGGHTGSLWGPTGTRLAKATFTEQTAAGWQEVRFATPVRIDANVTYTASYNSPNGEHGYNHWYFQGRGVDNGVLHALPDLNGVYFDGINGFPNQTFQNTNYWCDVVFKPDTYTIWEVRDAPAVGGTEATSLELGLRFSSFVDGRVHGVRFFKGTHNTGTHVGSLWTRSGTRLASATFTGETGFGWQEVRFASPVTIAAGQEYIVSYSSPAGAYSTTVQGMASGRQNAALHAFGATLTQPNGLFATSQGTFPTQSYENSNYYVDVVFSEV